MQKQGVDNLVSIYYGRTQLEHTMETNFITF